MIYLLIVSLVWAFSFGIIKGQLTGLDSNFVAFTRMCLSFILFLPFIKFRRISPQNIIVLVFLGMIQFGLMYVAYILAYQYLKAYQVALFTILTPIYVTVIHDAIEQRFHIRFLIAAILAILGAGIIVLSDISWIEISIGFFLMQVSNIAFAFGQVYYRKLMKNLPDLTDASAFVYLYFGAVLLTGIFSLITTDFSSLVLTNMQILSLIYLGIVASGICFFLWNIGARKANAGTLSVLNNLKIPLAILVSLLFFNESVDLLRLIIGGLLVLFAMTISENEWIKRIKKNAFLMRRHF